MWNKKWRSERDWNKYSSGFMLGKMKNNHGILNLALVALYSAQTHLMNVSQPLYSIPLWKYAEHMKLWHFRRLWQIRPVPFQAVGQRLYRTQSIWVWSDIWVFFSVLDNRLLADNLSQLSKVSIWLRKVPCFVCLSPFSLRFDSEKWSSMHFCREVGYVVNTFLLRFDSTNEIRLKTRLRHLSKEMAG